MSDSEVAIRQRNPVGLIVTGLILGIPAMMLWLGRWRLALLYFVVSLLVISLFFGLPQLGVSVPLHLVSSDPSVIFGLLVLPISAIGIVHGMKINKLPSLTPWYAKWPIALMAPLVVTLLLTFGIRTFLYQPFSIPSESSIPNLLVGDYIMISKSAYRQGDPQRGDTAVFKLPSNPAIDYVKRIVGLPGDRIQMVGGVLIINGEAVKLEAVELTDEFRTSSEMKFFRETLPGGRSYIIADLGETWSDNTEEYVVPEGHYFTMGDNRDNSQDSRYLDAVGYIPRENFVGPFAFRFWNSEGLQLIGRPQETNPNN